MNAPSCKPVVLLVLDGWGYSEQPEHNAILNARIPTWDHLWRDYPHLLIRCSGTDVGLPADQMGNSEVGHLNLGAGRVVYQEFTRISRAIKSGSFFTTSTLTDADDAAVARGRAVHNLALLSPGGEHSHEEHIQAMAKLAVGRSASFVGRYFARDRDHRWPRVQAAYDLITAGKAEHAAPDALTALQMAYY